MQLKIDALKEAAAGPGAGRRTPVVLASQLMAAEPYREGHPPARLHAGRGPGHRGHHYPAGPAAPATVTPLLGPADRGTMVSLMGPADPGTATPLMLPSR